MEEELGAGKKCVIIKEQQEGSWHNGTVHVLTVV